MKEIEKYPVRTDLLMYAKRCWDAMATFRDERRRCMRFTYGDQWGDLMPTPAGMVREDVYIRSQGNLPLKNNLIRRLVRNVLGVFRNSWTPPVCRPRDAAEAPQAGIMQRLLEGNLETNRLEELYARTLEEFLISGMAVHRKWFGQRGGRADCWTDFVSPECFFTDGLSRDFRGWDQTMAGEIHDMSFDELCASFAANEGDRQRLRALYADAVDADGSMALRSAGATNCSNIDFLLAREQGRCRVIEVWTREFATVCRCHDPLSGRRYSLSPDAIVKVERENERRRRTRPDAGHPESLIRVRRVTEEQWLFHFLAPTGEVLASGKSPYRHGRHPYVIKAYPFIDGEIHSFVSDIIDQQKFTNRLISMYDWILRASAKGVLLFPEEALPPGIDIADIAREWSRFNGVIIFSPKPGTPLPQQVSSKCSDIGITELLNIQMKMMEDISGVNGALQGKLDNASMSGTLYSQQTRNSMIALADLLRSYADFIIEGTRADASNIRQYYTPRRIAAITGAASPSPNASSPAVSAVDYPSTSPLADSPLFFDNTLDFSFTLAPSE